MAGNRNQGKGILSANEGGQRTRRPNRSSVDQTKLGEGSGALGGHADETPRIHRGPYSDIEEAAQNTKEVCESLGNALKRTMILSSRIPWQLERLKDMVKMCEGLRAVACITMQECEDTRERLGSIYAVRKEDECHTA